MSNAPTPTFVLPAAVYDDVLELVMWQYNAPIEFSDSNLEDLAELEAKLLDAGNCEYRLPRLYHDESGHEVVMVEDDDGVEYLLVRGEESF